MIYSLETLEEIHAFLTHIRSDTKLKHRFPMEVWESIMRLTKTYSIKEISDRLEIQQTYLKRKLNEFQKPKSEIEFQEVTYSKQDFHSSNVTIELLAGSGLRATIQGPLSCLNYLPILFKG
jgi:hypothetical protein